MRCVVQAAVEALHAVDYVVVAVADRSGLEPACIGAMVGLGEAEGDAGLAREHAIEKLLLLGVASVPLPHFDRWEIADDRGFVLEVVVQPQAFGGEVFPDDRHAEVRARLSPVLRGERVPVVAGGVSELAGPSEQLLPLLVRQPTPVPVGACVLPAMVEEPIVVVLLLEGFDLPLDELIEHGEVGGEIGRNIEVHRAPFAVRRILRQVDVDPNRSVGTGEVQGRRTIRRCRLGESARLLQDVPVIDLGLLLVKPETEPEGGILYNIPNKMQLGVQTKCIVRLAFDKKQLKKETDTFTDEVIKTVKVSEVMEIDLIDLSGENVFNIQFISQKEQFIDRNEASEWLIMVKALKAGSFSLALKVAVIEKINDKDRRKEMVLEELVAVVGETVAPSTDFKSASQPFQHVGAQTLLPNSNPSVKTVLFMGANPPGTQFLQLEIEHSRISVELEGYFRFPTAKFLSAAEMPKLFIIQKPNVVHFSGHGKDPSVNGGSNGEQSGTRGIGLPKNYEKTGGIIVFDNDMRGMKVIEDKALDYIFSNAVQKLKIPIEVVVFNSCHSESQAKVVGKTVPYVVGTAHAIKDDIAISFAVGFYFGLANGLSVEDAFTSGKMQAVMEDLAAENLIVLYINGEKSSL